MTHAAHRDPWQRRYLPQFTAAVNECIPRSHPDHKRQRASREWARGRHYRVRRPTSGWAAVAGRRTGWR